MHAERKRKFIALAVAKQANALAHISLWKLMLMTTANVHEPE